MTYTSHGHHIPGTVLDEKPKSVARCGGIGLCGVCSTQAGQIMSTMKTVPYTWWNGLPTVAAKGTAVVADDPRFPLYWAKTEGIIGQRIPVVMVVLDGVNAGGGIDYLDNRDGSGWRKVTEGHGSPRWPHSNVRIEPDSFRFDDDTRPPEVAQPG